MQTFNLLKQLLNESVLSDSSHFQDLNLSSRQCYIQVVQIQLFYTTDCFQVKPIKLQKSAGAAHMLKMQHNNLLIFIFSMMTQRFKRIMKDGGRVIVLVCLLAELLIKSWVDLHEQSEFMLSPAQSQLWSGCTSV